MPTILAQLDEIFRNAIQAAFGLESDGLVGVSQNEKFGDYQSNAAMGLVKILKTDGKLSPRAIAEQIKSKLNLGSMASEVTIAGPGFINVRLSPEWLGRQLNAIAPDRRLGIPAVVQPQNIVVDYSGPNIAKEMHVGHLRSTIIGDAISRVLEFQQNKIIRQNHIGDWGTQFGRVVLAIWYHVMAEHLHETEALQRLVAEMAQSKDLQAKAAVVHSLADLHRRMFQSDPDGTHVFEPALRQLHLRLSSLETLYQFVSAATDLPTAKYEVIDGNSLQASALSTTFIQDPKNPKNRQEELAWQRPVKRRGKPATKSTGNSASNSCPATSRRIGLRGPFAGDCRGIEIRRHRRRIRRSGRDRRPGLRIAPDDSEIGRGISVRHDRPGGDPVSHRRLRPLAGSFTPTTGRWCRTDIPRPISGCPLRGDS